MNKNSLKIHNLKLYRSITGFTASFVLATSLSGVPVYGNVIQSIGVESTIGVDSDEKEVVTDNNITFNGTYDNEEEVYNRRNQKIKEYKEKGYKNINSEINKYCVQEETDKTIEEYIDSDISLEENSYVFDNIEDAYNKKDELESNADEHDEVITVSINKKLVNSGEYEFINIDESFSSKGDAYEYLDTLKEKGYEVDNSTITQDSVNSEVSLEQTFDTYEEAEQALDDFKNKYDDVVTDGIIENRTDNVIDVIEGDTLYETEDLAWEALEEFLDNPDNETDEYYFTGEVLESSDSVDDVISINERFDSEEEALEYIWELEEEGYTVDDYTFVKDDGKKEAIEQRYDTLEEAQAALEEFEGNYPDAAMYNIENIEAGTVYNVETMNSDMKIQRLNKTPYVIIKDDDGIYIWTEKKLSEDEENNFKDTYESVSSDQVLTWEMLNSDNTMFINGYDTFQSFSNREITFELNEDDEINIDMDLSNNPYIVYGSYEPTEQYILSIPGNDSFELESGTLVGEATITRDNSMYYINFIKMAKTYSVFAYGNENSYADSYNLTAECFRPIMVEQYSLDVTTETKNYDYSNEVIDKTYYDLVISADITKELEKDKDINHMQSPSTGDNNMAVPAAGLVASSAVLAGYALVKKRKKY